MNGGRRASVMQAGIIPRIERGMEWRVHTSESVKYISLTCEWVGHEIGEGENEVDERDVLDSNADILHVDSEVRDEGEGGTREEEYDQLERQRPSIRLHPELR